APSPDEADARKTRARASRDGCDEEQYERRHGDQGVHDHQGFGDEVALGVIGYENEAADGRDHEKHGRDGGQPGETRAKYVNQQENQSRRPREPVDDRDGNGWILLVANPDRGHDHAAHGGDQEKNERSDEHLSFLDESRLTIRTRKGSWPPVPSWAVRVRFRFIRARGRRRLPRGRSAGTCRWAGWKRRGSQSRRGCGGRGPAWRDRS